MNKTRILQLFIIVSFSHSMYASSQEHCGQNPSGEGRKILEEFLELSYKKKIKEQESLYSILPYEKCNDSNDYFAEELEKSEIKQEPILSELSPVCSYASLKKKTKNSTYVKSCQNNKPNFTKERPCLSESYHKFVHKQIGLAAQCFGMDSRSLFSLYSTESYLQVNVRPSQKNSADGIAQLLPNKAVKFINDKLSVHTEGQSNRYQRHLEHFKNKNSDSKQCGDYFDKLIDLGPRQMKAKFDCPQMNLQDKVMQDIYYSIAYMLESNKHTVRQLIDNGLLPVDDYGDFLQSLEGSSSENIIYCTGLSTGELSGQAKQKCKEHSTKQVQDFIQNNNGRLKEAIGQLEETATKIGPSNYKKKLVEYFPQGSRDLSSAKTVGANASKFSDIYENNQFIQTYCKEFGSSPQLESYNENRRSKNAQKFLKDVDSVIGQLRDCKMRTVYAELDVMSAMGQSNKKIINELSFYHHNGGPKAVNWYLDYVKKYPGVKYNQFTGKGPLSFRNFVEKEAGTSTQYTNFIFNVDSNKSKSAGRHNSTQKIMDLTVKKNIKAAIKGIYWDIKLTDNQAKHVKDIQTAKGFRKHCSPY